MRDQWRAFNTHDLDHLLACLSADPTWVTGSDRSRGIAQLAKLFEGAFTDLSPKLTIKDVVIGGEEVACELSEHLVVDGATSVDHIAGSFLSVAVCCASR